MSPGIKLGILRVVPSDAKTDDGCKDTQAFGPLHKNFTSPSHLANSPSHLANSPSHLAMRLPIVSVSYVFLMLARLVHPLPQVAAGQKAFLRALFTQAALADCLASHRTANEQFTLTSKKW